MTQEEKKREIEFLYEWCKTIETFRAAVNNSVVSKEDWYPFEWAKERLMLRAFKETANDIMENALDLSPEHQAKLNAILMERFGMDLNTMKLRNKQKLEKALKRGYLKSDQEARMVEYWINEYCQAERPREEIDPLNALLSDYERRVEAKWAAKKAAKEAKKAAKEGKQQTKEG